MPFFLAILTQYIIKLEEKEKYVFLCIKYIYIIHIYNLMQTIPNNALPIFLILQIVFPIFFPSHLITISMFILSYYTKS